MQMAQFSAPRRSNELPHWMMVFLQGILFLAILYHIPEGGQNGRPTYFQVGLLAWAGLLVLRWRVAGRGAISVWRAMLVFIGAVSLSWAANIAEVDTINASLADFSGSNAYMKMTVLSFFSLATCVIGYWTGRAAADNRKQLLTVLWTIVIAASVNGGAVIVAWLRQTGGVLDRYNFILPFFKSYGLSATMSYTALLLIFPLLADRTGKRARNRAILITAAAICFLSVVLILSRQAIASVAIAVLAYAAITTRKSGLTWHKPAAVLIVLGGMFLFFKGAGALNNVDNLFRGLNDESDFGISGRENAIYGSIQVFQNHPILGVGYGFWLAFNKSLFAVVGDEALVVATPHNGAALIISELGVVGAAAFTVLNYFVLRSCWRATSRESDGMLAQVSAAIFALVAVFTVSQAFSNSLLLPPPAEASTVQFSFLLWLLIGICGGIEGSTNNRQSRFGGSRIRAKQNPPTDRSHRLPLSSR